MNLLAILALLAALWMFLAWGVHRPPRQSASFGGEQSVIRRPRNAPEKGRMGVNKTGESGAR